MRLLFRVVFLLVKKGASCERFWWSSLPLVRGAPMRKLLESGTSLSAKYIGRTPGGEGGVDENEGELEKSYRGCGVGRRRSGPAEE